jgi:hypothetical protein
LEKERRLQIELPNGIVLMISRRVFAEFLPENDEENARLLHQYYTHITSEDEDAFDFDNWHQYLELRAKFHIIQPSSIWPG